MTSIQHGAEYFARAVSQDQAGGAFGSAAVLRPAGSPFTGTSHAVKCVLFITFVFEFFPLPRASLR